MLPSQGAAWLNGEAFEYFRYLRDEPVAGLAATFVGGEGCRTVLRREPMLSSRTFMWQHFTRLTPARPSRPSPRSTRSGPTPTRRHLLRRPARRARYFSRSGSCAQRDATPSGVGVCRRKDRRGLQRCLVKAPFRASRRDFSTPRGHQPRPLCRRWPSSARRARRYKCAPPSGFPGQSPRTG